MNTPLSRRALLFAGALLGAGWLAACANQTPTTTATPTSPTGPESSSMPQPPPSTGGSSGRVLLAYFSRAGENYFNGGRRNLDVGNTEVLARMIAELTGPNQVTLHKIEPTDP